MDPVEKYSSMYLNVIGFGENVPPDEDPTVVLIEKTRRAIMTLLAERGPLTVKRISKILNLSAMTVLKHINILLRAKLIRKVNVEGALKIEKYYDISLPSLKENEWELFKESLNQLGEEISEHFREKYELALKIFKEKLPQLSIYAHIKAINPLILELAICQLLWSYSLTKLVDKGKLPKFGEMEEKWAGFMIWKG